MTKKVTDERLADMIRQCTDADNQPESLLWDEDVLVCLHELQRLRAIEPLKHQGYDGQMHSGIRSDCARCSIEPPVTNERTELLECLDQLAKHIRAGETLNQNNAASIVEDAAAALRAHEPECEHREFNPIADTHASWCVTCGAFHDGSQWIDPNHGRGL